MAQVFLSHSSDDNDFVRQLAADLRQLGHDPWLDEEQIQVGDLIPEKLQGAIERSDFVAIVLSKKAVASGWVKEEWHAKYWGQVNDSKKRILPILIEQCDIPLFLQSRAYADFRQSYGVGLVHLVRALDHALRPSPLTPDTELLNKLVNTCIESLGRAVSLPDHPGKLKIRVFIFKAENDELVCRYYWATDTPEEKVGRTRFNLSEEASKEIAVVRAALLEKTCRSTVNPLDKDNPSVQGDVDDALLYILAAPIFTPDGKVWGTVDFDTSTDDGIKLLSSERANYAINEISKHLSIIFTGS